MGMRNVRARRGQLCSRLQGWKGRKCPVWAGWRMYGAERQLQGKRRRGLGVCPRMGRGKNGEKHKLEGAEEVKGPIWGC